MEEFRQYPHYMQPRIHKMMQEVRALPAPLLSPTPLDLRPNSSTFCWAATVGLLSLGKPARQ